MPAALAPLLRPRRGLADMEEPVLYAVCAPTGASDPGNQVGAARRSFEFRLEEEPVVGRGRPGEPRRWEEDELEGPVQTPAQLVDWRVRGPGDPGGGPAGGAFDAGKAGGEGGGDGGCGGAEGVGFEREGDDCAVPPGRRGAGVSRR